VDPRGCSEILIWYNDSVNPSSTITDDARPQYQYSIFVTINGDIYVDNGDNGQVDKWTSNTSTIAPVMYVGVNSSCYGLFVDINDTLYCSIYSSHQVVTESLNSVSNMLTIVAGIGCAGSSSYMLSHPQGIFVDINFDLYVADCGNNRIQLFQSGQLNATTVAGNESSITTITLKCPSGIVLDADKYLFIVDSGNNRIVGSGPNGFRCIIGCSGSSGSAANQLYTPQSMAFDNYGNIFVADFNNFRVQKFDLNYNLGKCSIE
jgi:hypothetical protein